MSDFNKDSSNNAQDTRGFGGGSGLSAGVESGLSSVEKLSRGAVDAQQKTHGDNFMRTQMDESAGKKGGKNFTFRT
jgi:hypothetical protein